MNAAIQSKFLFDPLLAPGAARLAFRRLSAGAAAHHAFCPHHRAVVHPGGANTKQAATLAYRSFIIAMHDSQNPDDCECDKKGMWRGQGAVAFEVIAHG